MPAVVVEYQGTVHYQGDPDLRDATGSLPERRG